MRKRTLLLKIAAVLFSLSFFIQAQAGDNTQPLVSTQWVQDQLATISDPNQTKIRLIEVSKKYDQGHIPGALHIQWGGGETFDPSTDHMVLSLDQIERIMGNLNAPPSAHIVLYDGEDKVHFVARVYWTLKYWNYPNVSIMDGGKSKWQKENRPMSTEKPQVAAQRFEVSYPPNTAVRALYSPDIINALATGESVILDTRPEAFFTGETYSLDKWVRSGHITGAVNVPTLSAMKEDKTYKDVETLKSIYESAAITPDKKIITYCDTGVLGAHAWFVLHELLGYQNVKLYDGSMREYANRFDTPMQPGIVGGKFPKTPIQQLEEKIK